MIQEGEPCPNCGGTLVRISLREGMCDSCGSIVQVRYHTPYEPPEPPAPEILTITPAETITIDEFHRRAQNGEYTVTQEILQEISKTGRAMVTTTYGDTKVFAIIKRPITSQGTVVFGHKSMAVAVILGILIIGAGLMYAGRAGKGILFLILAILFCWTIIGPLGFWIIGTVEGCQLVAENNKLWEEYCAKDNA